MSRQNNVRLLRTAEILENACKSRKEGEIGVYGIAVSSNPAVCCFSSFWLTVFGKRRSFTVPGYRFTGGRNFFTK